ILVAVILGGTAGFLLGKTLRLQTEKDRLLATTLGMLMLVIGISLAIGADMLLATMTLGIVLTNYTPRLSQQIFSVIHGFTPPIYTLFFVLIGAKFRMEQVSVLVIVIALIYVVARMAGKMIGSYYGAKFAQAPRRVQRNLPLCLFSQAGVAIGLSIVAFQTFPGFIGETIVVVITLSTFVVQLIGPILTRFAVIRAEEAGLNVTEDDLIRKTRATDIMDAQPPFIYANTPLTHILSTFHNDAHLYYPVVDKDRRIIGIITVDTIKTTVLESQLTEFVIAEDLKEPVFQSVAAETPLDEVREIMDRYTLDYLPVVKDDKILVGFIERREVNKYISTKILDLQRKSDELDFST
ncbi:MAG: CBS domain-containing protein, partial [Candidatus Omnitrophica bacterium]|nr:CBS domain-containing protein [Candidatus Omnitrophota bacterium]